MPMKFNSTNFLCCLAASLTVLCCQKPDIDTPPVPDEPETPSIIMESDAAAAFRCEGGSVTLHFKSNCSVSATVSQDWCKAIISSRQGAEGKSGESGTSSKFEAFDLIVTVPENSARQDRTATVTLSAPECESKVIEVSQERFKSKTNNLTSLVLRASANSLKQDITFSYDKSSGTFSAMYLKWIDKAEPAMLIPEFATDGESVMVGGVEIVSGRDAVSFAEDFDITVRAEYGNECTYRVSLNCPQINTELPVMRFGVSASSVTSKEEYLTTSLELYRPGTAEGKWSSATDGEIQIRGRGNSTWGLPKKPYRIKFPEKFSPIGLNHATAKSWVILAHDMDKSLLRNHLAFEISRILFSSGDSFHDANTITFTPCSQFVNVYFGDSYHGVYQMSDQMEVAKGRIDIDKLKAADGSDATKITGGHLIETNIHHDEGYPVSFTSSKRIYMDHKYPEDDDMDISQYKYMENFITQAETALYDKDYFTDPDKGWRKYFDEASLADFIITKEFAGDMDGYTSTYFYKRRGVDKIYFGPIWDVDKGWNNDNRTPHSSYKPLTSLMIYAGFYMPQYVNPDWFHRFWMDDEFRQYVEKRWAAKREELKAKVLSELDSKPKEMEKAIKANFSVWTYYYQACVDAPLPAATYEKEIERMKTLTEQRAALLDNLFR